MVALDDPFQTSIIQHDGMNSQEGMITQEFHVSKELCPKRVRIPLRRSMVCYLERAREAVIRHLKWGCKLSKAVT